MVKSLTFRFNFRPRTQSERVKDLEKRNCLVHDNNFFQNFTDSTAKSTDLLDLVKGKTAVNFKFKIQVGEEPKCKMGSREHFGNVVQKVVSVDLLRRHHDCAPRNKKQTVGSHEPDYLLRLIGSAGESSILVVGMIKGFADRDREFSNEEVGQTLDFIREVLNQQGWREFVFGFLTDGIRFEFFRGFRGVDEIEFTRSGLICEGEGWTRLSQLLKQSDESLGFKVTTVNGWQLGDWLGSGASSSVFVATAESETSPSTAVCKIFAYDREIDATERRDQELRALRMMEDNEFTPKVASAIRTTVGYQPLPVLLVTPVGEKLGVDGVRLPISAFSKLVGTLKASHERQLCHLDICPDNMFAVKRKETGVYFVLLSDWGSSMTFREVANAKKISTHVLYYNVRNMGAAEDLAART